MIGLRSVRDVRLTDEDNSYLETYSTEGVENDTFAKSPNITSVSCDPDL